MRIPTLLLLFVLVLGTLPASAQVSVPPAGAAESLDDGPYVFWKGAQARVLRVHRGKVEETLLGPDRRLALDGLPALTLAVSLPPSRCVFAMPSRVAALSDIHGNFQGLVTLLERHGIMDPKGRWSFGQGHLVVAGDVFDRGAGVTESLWLLRSLEAQARRAGGRVHVLLGNHEVMALTGDLRYLNPKYAAVSGILAMATPVLYGPDSEQGRWLRSLNAMVRLGDILFAHGGPSPSLATGVVDLPALNGQFRQALDGAGSAALLGEEGPVWYRGLLPGASRSGEATEAEVTAILKAFQARTLVVGHSTLNQVTAFHGGRVFGIDAGLQYPQRGELWLREGAKTYRCLLDGRRIPLF